MKYHKIIQLGWLILLSQMISCQLKENKSQNTPQKPNVVLIISDDQSWTDYSFMGHQHINTPHLDKLAAQSLTFTYGYTTAPLCRPALASIITGLYPHQHQIIGNDPVFDDSGIDKYSQEWLIKRAQYNETYLDQLFEMSTIADLLKDAGYTSLQTGKWWEGHYSRGGFDQGMTHGDPENGGRHGDEGLDIGRNGMDLIFDFIHQANQKEQPFFIWYAPFLPHAPHNPPDSLLEKYLTKAPTPAVAKYWAMCEWFDLTCGQLINFIDQEALSSNTLIIYVTDNGWIQDPEKPNRYADRSKRTPYETGIRTPIMFRWPGHIVPKTDQIHPVSSIDIATTISGVTGLTPASEMPGINVLNQEALNQRTAVFAETYAHDFASVEASLYYRVAIDFPYKLILPDPQNKEGESPQLYHLVNDPMEEKDLAAKAPEKVRALKNQIIKWWKDGEFDQ